MSSAVLTAPCAAESQSPSEGTVYISLAEASRVSGLHETTVLRMALAGDIAFRSRGRRTLFSAADVRRATP
jgi:hypothetical protein